MLFKQKPKSETPQQTTLRLAYLAACEQAREAREQAFPLLNNANLDRAFAYQLACLAQLVAGTPYAEMVPPNER